MIDLFKDGMAIGFGFWLAKGVLVGLHNVAVYLIGACQRGDGTDPLFRRQIDA